MTKYDGYFITIEGGEGAGKTEQMARLKNYIESLGREVITTREPGGVEVAEKIRQILIGPDVKDMDAMTEVLLYAAARREHLIHVILPALKTGKVVVSDRYFDTSVVYQGFVKGIGWRRVYEINLEIVDHVEPNVTFFFDVEPEVGLNRIIHNNQREINRFDQADIGFHKEVQRGYRYLAWKFPERFVTIDANLSKEEVFNQVSETIKKLL